MKVDMCIQYWAHMLDEAFCKEHDVSIHMPCESIDYGKGTDVDEEESISNNDVYLSNMAKSFADKAWFLKYIPKDITTIVDFGGGTGDFAKFCRAKRPDLTYAVVDNNASFFDQAKSNGFIVASSL